MRRLPMLLLIPVLLLGLPVLLATADDGWPFGASASPLARGGDYYNLGILGAKASDADREAVALPEGGGMRRADPRQGGDDDGPLRLRIEILFPDGPAAQAGLRVGDVIEGLGRRAFREPCLAALAEALRKAEGKKGALDLLVRRGGTGPAEKVGVQLPVGGKAMRDPTEDEGRARILAAALAWLAERQRPDGGFLETLSGVNGSVVQTAVAGLAWIAGGSDLEGGPHRDNVRRAAEFVIAKAGRRSPMGASPREGTNWDQTNWGVAHAAIFLGELEGHSPDRDVRRALVAMGADLVGRQEASGGWAHAPGGPNALGYVELNIVSGLALAGIGLAMQAGYEPPDDALERADAYLRLSSSGDGGIGYSHQPGQQGIGNLGRTAGCWLAYLAMGEERDDWARKMEKYVERSAGDVFGGHASLMQHVLLGGVAAERVGKKAARRYWEVAERELVLARAPDGSLQPRPWHESLAMGSNSDVTFGEVWTTAAWAVVLGALPEKGGRPGLLYWTGRARMPAR